MPWAAMWRDLPCAAAAIVACLLFAMLAAAENDTRCLEGLKDSLFYPYGYLNWNFGNQNICSFNGVNCWSDSNNKVQSLSLGSKALSGQIPPALQYCASTTSLDLSYNLIAGEIPAQLCTWLPFLVYLHLSGNSLSGPIPDLSHCTNLDTLDLSSNSLSGQIPPTLFLLVRLNYIYLAFNNLSGPIPDLSHCTNLVTLHLSSNSLSGPIPDLSHCTNLVTLHLSGNNLFGPIPDLSHCTNLNTLDLSSNSLSGPIPDLSHCTNLVTLDLYRNDLSGPIPDLSHCTNLVILHLSRNLLSGPIPDLSHCTNLVTLHLSRNNLSGPIPDLSHCTNLNTLDLYSNNLSGQIHPTLSLLVRLNYINLAFNHLSGPIPDLSNFTKLAYFEDFAFSGNDALCGRPLPNCDGSIPRREQSDVGKTSIASLTIIIVPVILGVAASLLLIYSAYCWYLNQSMAEPPGAPLVEDHQRIRDWVEHPADLSFLAEGDGVAALELVGRGGCGDVYRAQLAGKTIAIKKIVKMGPYEKDSGVLDRRTRQARSEIITVGRIRHQNLLPLLAHVPRPDCNYLVYEFMNNGSLHDAIVGTNGLRLDWLARYGIAVGIAAGLEYLHHHHKPYLIHRDLKPENILLDEDLKARISDFGLAKEFPDDAQTHMSMSKVAGTIGYIAPEYYQTLKFTTKCDIYSLGVILASLVMGKLPSDDFFQDTEEMSMVKWLRNVMGSAEADLRAVIDERLLGRGFQKQMVLVLKISCFCTADDPKHRPTSTDVRCMLSQIKH